MRLVLLALLATLVSVCSGTLPQLPTNRLEQSSVCSPAEESYCAAKTIRANAVRFLSTNNAFEPSSYCCKVCSKGKACGDSCISREVPQTAGLRL
jgi:hypothetical protein